MNDDVLIINDKVEISEFDDMDHKKNYLIINEDRNWKVCELVYLVYCCIKDKKSCEEIYAYFLKEFEVKREQIDEIIGFFKESNIVKNSENIISDKNSKKKMLWSKVTIFSENIVKRAKFLSFLFNKFIFIPLSILSAFCFLFIFFTNFDAFKKVSDLNFKDRFLCYLILIICGIVHEFGHSVALLRCKENPGRIGFALYFIMPVLFSDVSRSWKLKRKERVLVDFGGIYFQGILNITIFFLNFFVFKNPGIYLGFVLSNIQTMYNLTPFINLDGYWIMCDYLGITDIKKVILNILKRKNETIKQLSPLKRNFVYLYAAASIYFFIYFVHFILVSTINAISAFVNDFSKFNVSELNIASVFSYLESRLISAIIIFFAFKIILFHLASFVKFLTKLSKGYELKI